MTYGVVRWIGFVAVSGMGRRFVLVIRSVRPELVIRDAVGYGLALQSESVVLMNQKSR